MLYSPALESFSARSDLIKYGPNGLLLFALQLDLGIEDVESVAATSLTDGPNDKKCDLVHVDRDQGKVIIAQSYMSRTAKAEANAGKASDLNTATSWLLSGELNEMPINLRSAAVEVRQALESGQFGSFEIWYVHNCPESQNVGREITQATNTAAHIIRNAYESSSSITVLGREVGRETLDNWYARTEVAISVTDKFVVPVNGGFTQVGEKWSAFCTSIRGSWLRDVWMKHERDLFSPNVRDFLGIVKSAKNINNGIRDTATGEADQFWIYNNGLTIIVNEIDSRDFESSESDKIIVYGLGVVNGAQTTGTLGVLSGPEAASLDSLWIMARFVKCSDPEVLQNIVKFNNTQNKVEAADFRSNDAVQNRLRREFELIPDADYRGGRRGGVREAIERKKNLLANNSVAQALAAFQGKPNLAYNDTRLIWVQDRIYADYFSDRTTARHIVFCFSLIRSIEEAKQEIVDVADGDRTQLQKNAMSYFRKRGSIPVLASAIAQSIESIVDRAIPNRFGIRFADNCSPREASIRWKPVVTTCLPFSATLEGACDRDLYNGEKVRACLATFGQLIAATASANRQIYQTFAEMVEYAPIPSVDRDESPRLDQE
ncbi:AIPR family protein [Saccharothrix sp. AJ9571]|nr:AIPR family protein [Saccharothrix sp. AJ9571]